jgi:hypothetical protein
MIALANGILLIIQVAYYRSILEFYLSQLSIKKKNFDDEQMRLVDDAFCKICNMINDLSVEVKLNASQLLVSFHSFEKSLKEKVDQA